MPTDVALGRGNRLTIKKSVDQVMREANSHALKRSLGAVNLVLLGIGCIIGAGIYVMTGNAAANFAGPAVMLSFVVAATVAAGWSGNVTSLLANFGLAIPAELTTSFIQAVPDAGTGALTFVSG